MVAEINACFHVDNTQNNKTLRNEILIKCAGLIIIEQAKPWTYNIIL